MQNDSDYLFSIAELRFDMADIVPLVGFLRGWLSVIVEREWTFDYSDPR
jgi:hypothetical protein